MFSTDGVLEKQIFIYLILLNFSCDCFINRSYMVLVTCAQSCLEACPSHRKYQSSGEELFDLLIQHQQIEQVRPFWSPVHVKIEKSSRLAHFYKTAYLYSMYKMAIIWNRIDSNNIIIICAHHQVRNYFWYSCRKFLQISQHK